jgi:hypothetical protein
MFVKAEANTAQVSVVLSHIKFYIGFQVTKREVLYALQRSCGETGRNSAVSIIDQLPVCLIAPDGEQTMAAAGLKARHPVDWLARR